MRNRSYIIRKKKEDAWTQPKKFFQLFLKKVLTNGFFSAILHIDDTDNTVNTVKTQVMLICEKILSNEEGNRKIYAIY